MKYLCLLSQNLFSQAYLIWVPKLDVPEKQYTTVHTDLKHPPDRGGLFEGGI